MSEMQKPCRKCLLADMDENEFLQRLKEHIAAYPEEKRAAPEEYARRLGICRECGSLSDGMCAKCGCYVELRALKRNMRCADEPKKW